MTPLIKIIDLKKKLGDRIISNGIDLEIPAGQTTVILGRSGEGKSVLLKQLIGLLQPDSGTIMVEGVDVTKLSETARAQLYAKFGYVFQFAALLDSLTVFENVGITMLEKGESVDVVLSVVKEKLTLVNLHHDILDKYPSDLSGGMRKRVGLARTLVTSPEIILYDEPTTGLDPITSRVIHDLIYDMQRRLNITTVIISHDVEIFKYADNVALLYEGKIRYVGDAKTVWESDNPYIYQFIRGDIVGPIQHNPDDE